MRRITAFQLLVELFASVLHLWRLINKLSYRSAKHKADSCQHSSMHCDLARAAILSKSDEHKSPCDALTKQSITACTLLVKQQPGRYSKQAKGREYLRNGVFGGFLDRLKISAQKLPHLTRENSLSLTHASTLSAVNINGAQRMQLIEEVGVFGEDVILLHADQPVELPTTNQVTHQTAGLTPRPQLHSSPYAAHNQSLAL